MARRPTIYRIHDDRCYYFDETHRGLCMSSHELFDIDPIAQKGLWILTDEGLSNPDWNQVWHTWFLVLAASPKKVQDSKQWVNKRNPGVTYINNWGWDEIYAAFV